MPGLFAFLAPAILLAAPTQDGVPEGEGLEPAMLSPPAGEDESALAEGMPAWTSFNDAIRPPTQAQVRMERRIIVRIAPSKEPLTPEMLANLPQREVRMKFDEKKTSQCIPLRGIAGVQAHRDNRLMIFMRDRKLLSATLEKSCRARDFYSGFYVEKNEDGMLCSKRDLLQSRSGANCELRKLVRLVPVQPDDD